MNVVSEIWSVLNAAQRRRMLGAQAISLAMAVATMAGIATIGPFFAMLGDPTLADRNEILRWLYARGGFSSRQTFTVALGIAFVAAVWIGNLVNAAGDIAMRRLALRIGDELQTTLFDEYLDRDRLFHTASHSTTLATNIVYEIERLTSGILPPLFALVTNVATGSFIVLSLLLFNPAGTVVLFGGLASLYAATYLIVRSRLRHLGQAHALAWNERARIVAESFSAIKEALLLPDRRRFRDDFRRAIRDASHATASIHAVGQIPRHVLESLAIAALAGIALVSRGRTGGLSMWLGELSFIGFAAYRLLPVLQHVFSALAAIRANSAGLALIADDLRRGQSTAFDWRPADDASPERLAPKLHPAAIRLRDVSFRYAPQSAPVLDRLSLDIAAGATVGIVGANGAGKTTLMNLIAGVLEPATGEVSVDGITLDAAHRAAWHARIAYVPQSIFLLDASLEFNIAFGVPREAIDRRRVVEAARLAQLGSFIAALPDGLDHVVGERGVQLSGGQRQKIAIARALFRDASVLLLDEATSALDDVTEADLLATIASLRGRFTTVLIAHRLSSVRQCDAIYCLDAGRIVASGTYGQIAAALGPRGRMIRA